MGVLREQLGLLVSFFSLTPQIHSDTLIAFEHRSNNEGASSFFQQDRETVNTAKTNLSVVTVLQNNNEVIMASFAKSEPMRFLLVGHVNLLKPTGYVMQQQFNIQQLYVLPTLYLCVLYLSENKQRLVPLTA